ncbi:CotO family spore coat protein [Cytobacillus sp. Hm23]
MKEKQKIKNTPFMYIIQPNLSTIESSMQKTFIAKVDNSESINENDINNIDNKDSVEKIEHTENVIEKRKYAKKSSIKPFKEMDLVEKVKFLANPPKQLPRVKCKIKTINDMFEGTIIEQTDEKISMHLIDTGDTITINIDEVELITMVGLS